MDFCDLSRIGLRHHLAVSILGNLRALNKTRGTFGVENRESWDL
jgi:hypothetical protein